MPCSYQKIGANHMITFVGKCIVEFIFSRPCFCLYKWNTLILLFLWNAKKHCGIGSLKWIISCKFQQCRIADIQSFRSHFAYTGLPLSGRTAYIKSYNCPRIPKFGIKGSQWTSKKPLCTAENIYRDVPSCKYSVHIGWISWHLA